MRSMPIFLALFGLLAGAVRPPSARAETPPPANQRRWVEVVHRETGQARLVSGWLDAAGRPCFSHAEYPDYVLRLPPVSPAPAPARATPFPAAGVVAEKIPRPVAGQAWYGGNASRVVEAGGEPKSKPPDVHLTVIGDEPRRSGVRSALESDPRFRALAAEMGDRLAVQFYPADNPMVARVGLVDGGRPDVVIQDATGKELKRFHADPGPGPIVAEIRKADPAYVPGRDDAGAFPFTLSGPALGLVAVVGGLVALGISQRRKAPQP